jgi:hypothetical protein
MSAVKCAYCSKDPHAHASPLQIQCRGEAFARGCLLPRPIFTFANASPSLLTTEKPTPPSPNPAHGKGARRRTGVPPVPSRRRTGVSPVPSRLSRPACPVPPVPSRLSRPLLRTPAHKKTWPTASEPVGLKPNYKPFQVTGRRQTNNINGF